MSDKTFHLKLLAPDASIIDAPARAVTVPGTDGDFTILPDHAPIVSSMRKGIIKVHAMDQKEPISFTVSGGFVDADQRHCTILAEDLAENSV